MPCIQFNQIVVFVVFIILVIIIFRFQVPKTRAYAGTAIKDNFYVEDMDDELTVGSDFSVSGKAMDDSFNFGEYGSAAIDGSVYSGSNFGIYVVVSQRQFLC